jgi:hypothetical protein
MQEAQGTKFQEGWTRLLRSVEAIGVRIIGQQPLPVGRQRDVTHRCGRGRSSQIIWIVVHVSLT